MASIAWITLDQRDDAVDLWPAVAATVANTAARLGVSLRECILLVPFAQLLPLANRALAQRGGWMPRVETTQTLAVSLGPQSVPGPGELSFDLGVDALNAEAILQRQGWARAWARHNPVAFKRGAIHLAQAAHALARAAHAIAPPARSSWLARSRELLAPADGGGARERALARIALEWAALGEAPATDRLFGLRPAAWLVLSAGGRDPLTLNLLGAMPPEVACEAIDLDAGLSEDCPFPVPAEAPALVICETFEDEAQCAAAQVLQHLAQGCRPVALIAQDRVLVRRVRALLARESVSIRDETGWKLSTTRAAGRVMALLCAAAPDATSDELLDWLKSGPRFPSLGDDAIEVIGRLEAQCRRSSLTRVSALASAPLEPRCRALLRDALACVQDFAAARERPLRAWASALRVALQACAAWQALGEDDAGRQVIAALGLAPESAPRDSATGAAAHLVLTLSEFTAWADLTLESANFLLASGPDAGQQPTDVVIAPLAQTIARPFAAVVFPGVDHTRLGAAGPTHPLLSDAQAVQLGLPGLHQRRQVERLAFAHLLCGAPVTLLRRSQDGEQRLANSPFVEQLADALQKGGSAFAPWVDPRPDGVVAREPIARTGPAVVGMLPQRLSASAFEALRECPYRFFAKVVLRLREHDEIERDLEKRDYGNWLHAVLHRFHLGREQPASHAAEVARLTEIAQACRREVGLDEDEFLPFAASFKSLAPRYVEWLHERDREGQRWTVGEHEVICRPEELSGVELEGHIDRIDVIGESVPSKTLLIDYKTGSVEALKRKVREPLEDTQLAFYAALMPQDSPQWPRPLRAIYLALDSRKGIEIIEHVDVETSAHSLVNGLAGELQRLRGGERLLPLGEGDACDYCEARGLCRRDHWSSPELEVR